MKKDSFRLKRIFKRFCILFVTLSVLIYFWEYFQTPPMENFDEIIYTKSKKYSINPYLVRAVISQESEFDYKAQGKHGEVGLMQIRPSTAVKDWENNKNKNIKDKGLLYNPRLNIEVGTWYLSQAKQHWKDYKSYKALMLAEYNAGYSNVKKWVTNMKEKDADFIKHIAFSSTKNYVKSILNKYKTYESKGIYNL